MKHTLLLVAFLLLVVSNGFAKTELIIQVKDLSGQPAVGVEIYGQQTERSCDMWGAHIGRTDEAGKCRLVFLPELIQDQEREGKKELPYGLYRFLLLPKNYRWEMSDHYYWYDMNLNTENSMYLGSAADYRERQKEATTSNLRYGEVQEIVPEQTYRWDVTLSEGKTYRLQFRDQMGKPIVNARFSLKMEIGSYLGGHVFPYTTGLTFSSFKADKNGETILFRVNDELFYSIESNEYFSYYAPDPDMRHGMIQHFFSENPSVVTFKRPVYHNISIQALDAETKQPIPDATFGMIMFFPGVRQGESFGRGFKGVNDRTDKQGRFYTDRFFTDHVDSFYVAKEGYQLEEKSIKEFQPGGEYIFSLKKEK